MKNCFKVYLPLLNYDQDAEPVAKDTHLIVCDGLGGDGSSNHFVNGQATDIRKSAYLGSRKLSEICDRYFSEHYEDLLCESAITASVSELKCAIKKEFDEHLAINPRADSSTGGGVFPTTLASAVFKETEDSIEATVIWAGDSRAYVFELDRGLRQISKDDVIGEFDACFGKDCRMGNCISQDRDFKLNFATYKLPKKCVLFVCSDGCFDFMSSPIHFEFEIMRALFSKENYSEAFEKTVCAMKAGDDCTMAGCVFNLSPSELQEFIKVRIKGVKQSKEAIDNSDAEYDKLVESNKSEVRKLNSENRKLNEEVFYQIQNLIIDAFRNDIENSQVSKLIPVSNALREYAPYNEFIESVFEQRSRIENNIKMYEKYKVIYKRLSDLVDKAERQKRIFEIKNRPRKKYFDCRRIYNVPFSKISAIEKIEKKRNLTQNDYLFSVGKLESKLIESKEFIHNYDELIYDFSQLMDTVFYSLRKLDIYEHQLDDEYNRLSVSVLGEAELKNAVIPYVIKNGVFVYKDFLDEIEYSKLQDVYGEYKNSAAIIDSIEKDGLHLKEYSEYVNDFINVFLKSHSSNLFNIIKTNPDTSKMIPSLILYQENARKLDELQKDMNNGKIIKRQKWSEYRADYELFRQSVFSGEV